MSQPLRPLRVYCYVAVVGAFCGLQNPTGAPGVVQGVVEFVEGVALEVEALIFGQLQEIS
jgi:hypothetical protein